MKDFFINYWPEVAVSLVVAILTGLYHRLAKQMKEEKEKRKAADDGLQALLRNSIIDSYNHYVVEKKFCPVYGKENVDAMYDAYHRLGGNGTVTRLVNQINELPTEAPVI